MYSAAQLNAGYSGGRGGMSELLSFSEIEKILTEHKYTRNCALVARRHQSRQNISAQLIASRYTASVGLTLTQPPWQVLPPHEATQRLAQRLCKSSIYQRKRLHKLLAQQVASSFVGLFANGRTHCLEGVRFAKDVSVITWVTDSYALADEATVVFDDTHIGLIYIEEN